MSRGSRGWVVLALIFVALTVTMWAGHYVVEVRDYGWDDGAITEAYARTFSATGRIALTPTSQVGEGFSSPAWFGVLSLGGLLARPFGGLGYEGFILAGQWGAVGCAAGAACLMTLTLRRWTGMVAAALTSIVVYGGAGMINEAMNGMEMLLLCLVAQGMLLATQADSARGRRWLALLAFVVPFVRLEAVVYLAGFGLLLGLRRRRELVIVAAASASGLALVTAARLITFRSWLPNTMLAKQLPPYTPLSAPGRAGIARELGLAAWPIVIMLLAAGVALVGSLMVSDSRRPRPGPVVPRERAPIVSLAAFGWVLGCAALNFVLGLNWGFPTRMELSMIAMGVTGAAALTGASLAQLSTSGPAALRVAALGRLAVPALALVAAWSTWDATLMAQGELEPAAQHSDALLVTPHFYRSTGLQVDRIRSRLGRQNLSYMVPDVGGTALCCSHLTIVDSALLTNPTLTRRGWTDFNAYVQRVAPDVIETHWPWSDVSGIYTSEFFRGHYRPVFIGNRYLYVRRDLLHQLRGECRMEDARASSRAWYRGIAFDEDYVRAAGFRVCKLT